MAIEKSLPNVRTTATVPSKKEELEQLQEQLAQQSQEPVEITRTEDGGAEINFDPRAIVPQGGQNHEENLAEFLDDDVLKEVGSQVLDSYSDYKSSRSISVSCSSASPTSIFRLSSCIDYPPLCYIA